MALTDTNGLTDNRTPVTIQGIKESTLTLRSGKKKGKIVKNLKEAGATVSKQKTTVNQTNLPEKRDQLEQKRKDLRKKPPKKATGKIEITALEDGGGASTVKGRTVQTNGPIEFELDKKLNINAGNTETVSVTAKENGNAEDSFFGINNILATDGIASINPLSGDDNFTPGRKSQARDDVLDSELQTVKRQLARVKEAIDKKDDNIDQLIDSGILGEGVFTVQLSSAQPNISVNTSNRFVEHKTVDGAIIRQKIGKGNVEVTMEGVCTTPEANLLDNLPNENRVFIESNRFQGNVTVDTISTNPIEDGGGMNLDGKFTHEFSLTLVQVEAR